MILSDMIHLDSFLHLSTVGFSTNVTEKVASEEKKMASEAVAQGHEDSKELANEVYDLIRIIKDPEKPNTLEELKVVEEDGVSVVPVDDSYLVRVEFVPTVPHCSLATLIGLSLRVKLERNLLQKFKLDIVIRKGTHSTEDEINKQINDKERIAAAMENPSLLALVNSCVDEVEM